jgi:hypothetical protein
MQLYESAEIIPIERGRKQPNKQPIKKEIEIPQKTLFSHRRLR